MTSEERIKVLELHCQQLHDQVNFLNEQKETLLEMLVAIAEREVNE